jgi:spermidine/putrescine transport system substrate-binding protein
MTEPRVEHTRRDFIVRGGQLAAMLGLGVPLLQACGGDDDDDASVGTTTPAATPAPGTTAPSAATSSADSASTPEHEPGPLRIFNYPDYVNPEIIAAFEAKYGVKVEITTFDVDSEAITKLAQGAVEVDLHHSAAPNTLDRLIQGGLLQPLDMSLIPNFRANVLESFHDPWYDPGSAYTVPYTVFSTGIGYRADRIDPALVEAAGWDIIWDPTYKGVTSILDDYREGLSMAMLRKGETDVNTTDEAVIHQAGDDLRELTDSMNIKVNIEGYKDVPEGSTDLAHTWSGDMLAGAYSYLPEGTDASVLGWWYPADGVGVVNNDCMAVTANAKSPILAHLYMNFLLDAANAETNFSWNGYLPPIKGLDADYLIAQGYVPENLRSAVLTDDVIAKGLRFEPLPLETDLLWEDEWSRFTAG